MMPKLLDGEQLWLALDTNHGAVMDHCEALRLRAEDAVARAQQAEAANTTLQAELAAARSALEGLTGRGSIVDWAIEAVAVWNHFVSTTDSEAPPSEALAITLNVLDSKVSEYQRQQKALTPTAADDGV